MRAGSLCRPICSRTIGPLPYATICAIYARPYALYPHPARSTWNPAHRMTSITPHPGQKHGPRQGKRNPDAFSASAPSRLTGPAAARAIPLAPPLDNRRPLGTPVRLQASHQESASDPAQAGKRDSPSRSLSPPISSRLIPAGQVDNLGHQREVCRPWPRAPNSHRGTETNIPRLRLVSTYTDCDRRRRGGCPRGPETNVLKCNPGKAVQRHIRFHTRRDERAVP
jgi:hypothetical protein